jgi:hypothetical protein
VPKPEPATLLTRDQFSAPDAAPKLGGDPSAIVAAPASASAAFTVLKRSALPAIPAKVVVSPQ